MRKTSALTLTVALAALLAVACGEPQPAADNGDGGGSGPTTPPHPVHLQGGAFANNAYACNTCHNSSFQVSFPAPSLGQSNGATPSFDATSQTCSNVYCHAGGQAGAPGNIVLGGGTLTAPIWSPPSTIVCGSCHALPGGAVATPWHPAVAANVACSFCHPGFTRTTVDKAVHVNGQRNVKNLASCSACHGDSAKTVTPADPLFAAPPVDRTGSSATTSVGVGAHQAHLTGTLLRAQPIACTECHAVPSDLVHVGPALDTPASFRWGPLATTGGLSPTFNLAPATCSSTYCHGTSLSGGATTVPQWTKVDGSQVACTSCHGNPPPTGQHTRHVSGQGIACVVCHAGYAPVNKANHINGTVNVDGSLVTTWTPATQTCTAVCHGSTSMVW